MTRIAIGAYQWVAILEDGREIAQFPNETTENSIDCLAHEIVRQVHLFPLDRLTSDGSIAPSRHVHVCLDVPSGARWTKYWNRTFSLDTDTLDQTELPCIDTVGLALGEAMVYLHIYPDGSVRFSGTKEPT